ncbi:uncharacterized protein LOC131650033 [Vicia villosa]|uniref:uncharacterized protein LOC131650033 n=1 Tax=Vicia villosa TaxID=3911 RepID=UPI00273BC725|nr:uncharacterized protein LOC131650033 [Vicia villosa]
MSSGFGESVKSATAPPNPSCSSGKSSTKDAGDFECNICLDFPLDPVVTLCGHLFCWPCLYRWLHHRSRPQGCPVCKAMVKEQKLVPLYGTGKLVTDPRMKSYLGMEIPPRPSGQRPPTVLEQQLETHTLSLLWERGQPVEEFRAAAEQRCNEYIDERIQEYRAATEQHVKEQIQHIEEYRVSIEQRFNECLDQRIEEFRAAYGI